MDEMTEERWLAELHKARDEYILRGFPNAKPVIYANEIDRLRAENERLRSELREIAYNTSTSIPFAAPPETYIVGQLRSVISRAARALNPEPEE